MIKKGNKIVQYIIATIIALSTLVFCFLHFSKMDLANSNVKIIVKVRVEKAQHFNLYYTSDDNFSNEQHIDIEILKDLKFQYLTFDLPHLKNLRKIRLDFGEKATEIEIESITFKGYSSPIQFKGEKLLKIISSTNDIKSVKLNNGILTIKTHHGDPFVYFDMDCNKIYHQVTQGTFSLSPFKNKLNVSINLKLKKEQYISLYYSETDEFSANDHTTSFVKNKKEFQVINFTLPYLDSLKNLRLDLNEETVQIQSITLNGIGGDYLINAKDLLYDLKPINDIESVILNNNILTIKTNGLDPYLYFNFDTNTIYEKVTKIRFKSTPFYYALILSLILFLWIINLNPTYLKVTKNSIFIYTFMLIIVIPLLSTIFSKQHSAKTYENRIKTKQPIFDIKTPFIFPQKFESYFNDNFITRDNYLQLNSVIKAQFLGISPLQNKVMIGKNGWLFFSYDCDPKLNNAGHLLSENELEIIKNNLEERRAYLKEKGIAFYTIIPPTKTSIYPEFLPSNIPHLNSKLTQLINYLEKHSTLRIIDVRNELLIAKEKEQIYYKNDTHWNSKGAFVAYSKLLNIINHDFPKVKPLKREELSFKLFKTNDGDLGGFLMLKNYLNINKYQYFLTNGFQAKNIPKEELYKRFSPYNFHGIIKRNTNQNLPKLLMYRDSYTMSLIPIISENFSESTYLWTYQMTPEIIDREKPDIVVLEIVERYFDHLLIPNTAILKRIKK